MSWCREKSSTVLKGFHITLIILHIVPAHLQVWLSSLPLCCRNHINYLISVIWLSLTMLWCNSHTLNMNNSFTFIWFTYGPLLRVTPEYSRVLSANRWKLIDLNALRPGGYMRSWPSFRAFVFMKTIWARMTERIPPPRPKVPFNSTKPAPISDR